MNYPLLRLRRLRQNKILRNLVSENRLNIEDLIYPIFVCEGKKIKKEIESMPGQYKMSIDQTITKCKEAIKLGADYLVIGRPIIESKNPLETIKEINQSIQ